MHITELESLLIVCYNTIRRNARHQCLAYNYLVKIGMNSTYEPTFIVDYRV
jgi:hypothetical protein